MDLSLAAELAALSEAELERVVADLTDEEAARLEYDWSFWARPKQMEPLDDWFIWLILAGRGFGKTRTGAEWIRSRAEKFPGCRIALVGPTAADVRDTMVEGESGLIAISPPGFTPDYEPSKRRLTWPNGSRATCFSADEPNRLRGPQHHFAWADELAAWRYVDAWDQLMFGLRLGRKPQVVVTTTPRPTKLIRELKAARTTRLTTGTTYENISNLAPPFVEKIVAKYEGTRLGRQELNAEILDDTPGALWTIGLLDRGRVTSHPPLRRQVIAIDPSVAADGGGDECGIVRAGVAECDCKVAAGGKPELHGFVLDDLSDHLGPDAWATRAVVAYSDHGCDRIVAEVNNGGALVESTIRSIETPGGVKGENVPYSAVHASQGKRARAEPISALYEQGKVHHVGSFPKLEDEQRTWNPLSGDKSPNRLDALVWALTELMLVDEFFFV